MPRRIFPASSVTNTTGAPIRLSFHYTQTGGQRATDLFTVDGSNYASAGIPNGTVLTDASGNYSAFAGPDDVDTLWVAPHTGAARTQITATGTVANGTAVDSNTYGRLYDIRERPDRTLRGWLVGTNCYGISHSGTSQPPAQSTSGTGRSRHRIVTDCSDLRLVYHNASVSNTSTEIDGSGQPYVINVGVELSGTIYRVTFGGRTTGTVDPGGHIVSDPIGLDLTAGTDIYVRTYISASSWYPNSACYLATGAAGGWTDTTDLTAPGAGSVTNAAHWLFSPAAIIGTPTDRTRPSVAVVGDSIAVGYNDGGDGGSGGYYSAYSGSGLPAGGYVTRGLGTSVGWINVAHASDTVQAMVATGAHNRRGAIISGATHAIVEYGINDVLAGRSLSAMQADLTSLWAYLVRRGMKVFQTTITPRTTSTDGWVTTANQTVVATESVRVALNNWIRTTPSPLTGYFEAADLAETGRNTGIWRATYTADGIHPGAAASAAMAACIDTAQFTF